MRRNAGNAERLTEASAHTPVFFFSIDIAGSTQAKARIRELARRLGTETAQLYEMYYRAALQVEASLWQQLHALHVAFDRLFQVKSLGDEAWYTYDLRDLPEWRIERTAVELIVAFLAIQSKAFSVAVGPQEDPYDQWDGTLERNADILRLDLPLKITAEIVLDGLDVGALRDEFLKGHLPSLLVEPGAPPQPVVEGDDRLIDLYNRLNIGSRFATAQKVHSIHRTDLVGWEVDRFFRLTGKAMPGGILVGSELWQVLERLTDERMEMQTDARTSSGPLRIRQGEGSYTSTQRVEFSRVNISANELKGIGEPIQTVILSDDYGVHRDALRVLIAERYELEGVQDEGRA